MKNFTNNFKQFTSRLSARWLIMALMMLVGTSSAWGFNVASSSTIYFDNQYAKFANCYLYIGKKADNDNWTSVYQMSLVSGTRYLYKIKMGDVNNNSAWNGATAWYISSEKWWDSKAEYPEKNTWHAANTFTQLKTVTWYNGYVYKTKSTASSITEDGNTRNGYQWSDGSKTSNPTINYSTTYTITLNIVGSGSVTIKNNAGTALISGATANTSESGVQYLTYLKNITATPAAGSKLSSIKIGSNDYTDAYKSGSDTNDGYDLTGNVTITVTFEQDCITPDAPFGGEAQSETICKGSPYEFDSNYKWYTGSTGETTVSGSEEIYSNTDYYIVNVAPEGCESARTKYTINVDEPLVAPTLIPTNPTTCNGNPTAGSIVIENYANYSNEISFALYKDENPTGIAYNNGFAISEEGSYKVVMTTSASNVCGQSVETEPISIEIVDVTPTVNSFAITKQANVCMGNPVTLSYDGTAQSGTISYAWYEGDSEVVIGTESTLTIQQAKNASYKLVVTVTSNDCPASAEATTTVEPKAVPSAPTFDKYEMDACVNQQFTLPMPNNLKYEEEPLWTVDGLPTTASQTINVDGEYTYTAYKNDGCPSQGTPFIVRVNPLPTINIGEDVTAVKFEDVVLTATGNNIADVTWTADKGTITKDATDPTKAVLTYDQTGEVTVTATATSAAGCTSAATKTVTFSEETCEPTTITVPANYIEIYCKYNDAPTQHDMKVDIWKQSEGQGTESYQSCSKSVGGYAYWKFNITDDANYCIRISNKEINYKSGSMCTLTRGHKYYFDIPGGWSGWTDGPNKSKTQDITETQDGPPAITTPAVKMLSAFSEEGSGELSMTAQIVKTGCNGNMTYYFKYRLKGDQAWSQTTPQTATGLKAGDEINETVSGLDQGGTYEIQAVINNNNEAVSNILEYVVNIQETEISDVTLQFADEDGNVLQNQNQIYCVGSTAYIKLSYDGTAHKSLEWIAENELQPVNGEDKLFSYVVRGDETITANVANNENKGTPATGTIDINVYTIATTPDISIDRTEVCSTDPVGAKITVKAPQEGITYRAYKMVDDVETPHGDAVVADNAESIIINSIKETGTYYVKAWNAQCLDAIAVSLSKFAVTKIDASSNTIAISPVSASTNPWMPVTVKVDKNSAYDYTLVCKQGNTDVTDQMVINKKGDSYVIKFPKPESAEIDKDGQVVFDDITYNVVATLNGDVQCGTTSATSTVTLTNLIEDCD